MTAQQIITEHLDIWTAAHKTRSIAGRGSNNKLNLHGIKKLRELILELAVRGKLVPQDANDEPAIELLIKISAEKNQLIKDGKIKKAKADIDTSESDKPFDIPNNWQWSKLSDISIINPRNTAEDELDASFVPMTLIDSRFDGGHEQELRQWKEIKQGFTHFAEGDIGVAKITPCFENSKACVFKNLANNIGAGTTELHIVRPINNTLNPRYVLACLKSPSFLLVGETKMTGTAGQKRLPKDFLEAYPFALPPLAEQHRIVAKVDKLMAFCDQLEQTQSDNIAAHAQLAEALLATLTNSSDHNKLQHNRQRIAEHFDTLFTTEHSIDQLKQTILQLAVMGKLVPQNPNDEPASELLKKIAAEKTLLIKEGKIKKGKPLPEITEEEKPFELPRGWEFVRMGLFSILKGGFAYQSSKFSDSGEYQVIRMGNIRPDYLRINEKAVFIKSEYASATTDYKLEADDILLTMTGTKNKRDYLYSVVINAEHLNDRQLYINQRLCAVKAPRVNIKFLSLCLKNDTLLDAIFAKSTGTANQANIGMEAIACWVVPLAPLEEQHRIVAKVDELMALCDTLKTNIQNAQTTQLALADVLVEKAVE